MPRVEFRLSMPGRSAWDGGWSGGGRNYVIVRPLRRAEVAALMAGQPTRSWYHFWPDGWTACVTARVMERGERAGRSDGFSGYDWMVANILAHGSTSDRAEASDA